MAAEPLPDWVDPNLINYMREIDQNPATPPGSEPKKPTPQPPAGREDKDGNPHK